METKHPSLLLDTNLPVEVSSERLLLAHYVAKVTTSYFKRKPPKCQELGVVGGYFHPPGNSRWLQHHGVGHIDPRLAELHPVQLGKHPSGLGLCPQLAMGQTDRRTARGRSWGPSLEAVFVNSF